MDETRHFALPLLAAGQAQKHVTVNEALTRLDGLAAGLAESATRAAPPAAPAEGDLYVVPEGGAAAWQAPVGMLCLRLNGGWESVAPRPGQRLWVRDAAAALEHDGAAWRPAGTTPAMFGHAALHAITLDHDLAAGETTVPIIPDKAVVFGVTGRVLDAVTGAGLTSWNLGTVDAPGRYGSGYGLDAGSWAQGVTGAPVAYYGDTSLLIVGEGGPIAAGRLRLCVHALILTPPAMG
jgi:hypothetical protein